MKSFISCLILILAVNGLIAQNSLECPPDVIVSVYDLDENYEYGDAIGTSNSSFEIESSVELEHFQCNDPDYLKTATKTFSMIENGTQNLLAQCLQKIHVQLQKFSDYSIEEELLLVNTNPDIRSPEDIGGISPLLRQWWKFIVDL